VEEVKHEVVIEEKVEIQSPDNKILAKVQKIIVNDILQLEERMRPKIIEKPLEPKPQEFIPPSADTLPLARPV